MHEIVTINVTTFRGSIGGEHYYGKLSVQSKYERTVDASGEVRLVTRGGFGVETHPHDNHELRRKLGTREAAYLNKKDHEDGITTMTSRLKAGDMTNRFNDVESILKAATEAFPTLFDETDVLMFERERHSGSYEILAGPAKVLDALSTRPGRQAREEWLMANGYMVKDAAVQEGGR